MQSWSGMTGWPFNFRFQFATLEVKWRNPPCIHLRISQDGSLGLPTYVGSVIC